MSKYTSKTCVITMLPTTLLITLSDTMPASRPNAPIFIVEQQRPAADLLELRINHRKLVGITSTSRLCLNYLAEYHLIANTMICAICHQPARLTAYQGSSDGFRWKSSGCNFVKSVRHGNFFSEPFKNGKNPGLHVLLGEGCTNDTRCRGGRGEHRPYGSRLVQLHARSLLFG